MQQCGIVIFISFNVAAIAGAMILYRVFQLFKVHLPSFSDCCLGSPAFFFFSPRARKLD